MLHARSWCGDNLSAILFLLACLADQHFDPAILLPGDVVFVPEKNPKEVSEPTNQVHKFRMKNAPAKFHEQCS